MSPHNEESRGLKIRGTSWPLPTITGIVYLDMLKQFLIPQLTKMTRILHPWIFHYGESLAITIPGKPRCFSTLRQFKTLYMSSEYIYIIPQCCKSLFATSCISVALTYSCETSESFNFRVPRKPQWITYHQISFLRMGVQGHSTFEPSVFKELDTLKLRRGYLQQRGPTPQQTVTVKRTSVPVRQDTSLLGRKGQFTAANGSI
jgi:hypothetical protein